MERPRPRPRIALAIVALVAAAMLSPTQTAFGAQTSPHGQRTASWTRFHFDAGNTGYNPRETVLSPATVGGLVGKWTVHLADLPAYIRSSPAVVNGRIYIGLCCVSYTDSALYALDAQTGAVLWSQVQPGGGYTFDPTVAHGTVYVGTLDAHRLYAYDAVTGRQRWVFQAIGAVHDPVVVGKRLYVAINSGILYCLDARSGSLIWQASLHGASFPQSVAVAYGMVFVGSDDANLYAFDARTGAEVWHAPTGGQVYSSAAVAKGMVYLGSITGAVDAFDARTGNLEWAQATGAGVSATPTVAAGMVYVADSSNTLYALNASTGAELWTYQLPGTLRPEASAANGVVYVSSGGTAVLALGAASGKLLWSFDAQGPVFQEPVVVNGALYVASDDGNLYAFHLPTG